MKRKFYLLLAMLTTLILIFIIILNTQSGETSFFSTSILTPTVIPPDILTQRAAPTTPPVVPIISPTQTSSSSIPSYDPQTIYPHFPEAPNAKGVLAGKMDGILAGHGILTAIEAPIVSNGPDTGAYELTDLAWEQWTYDSYIDVWAGRMTEMPSQGVVWVQITANHGQYQNQGTVIVKSPTQAGGLEIIGAVGTRLILKSDQGQTLYFDVPGLSFVDTLDEEIPTVTPASSATSNNLQEKTDDAADWQTIARMSMICTDCLPEQRYSNPNWTKGREMQFLGALTNFGEQNCGVNANSPNQGWLQLYRHLVVDIYTDGAFPYFSSDITFEDQQHQTADTCPIP